MASNLNQPTADPMAVMQLSSAYWHSSVLHVAQQLDLFSLLAEKSMTAKELAHACGAQDRGMEMLLIACVGLGLLSKDGQTFTNSELSQVFLRKSSPRYQGGIVSMFQSWVPAWEKLGEAVLAGQPVVAKQHELGPERTHSYIMGMLYRGIPQAELLSRELPLTTRRSLLDVGGGPGIFSIQFCRTNPQLRAVVLDLPQTLLITQQIIEQYQAGQSVTTQEGDYLVDTFGCGYDTVLLSSMINQEGDEVVSSLLRKAYAALSPGGLLILQEQLLNDAKTGPLLAVLIGLNQLIHTPAGRAYCGKEIAAMAAAVGFTQIKYRALPEPSPFVLLTAIKA